MAGPTTTRSKTGVHPISTEGGYIEQLRFFSRWAHLKVSLLELKNSLKSETKGNKNLNFET